MRILVAVLTYRREAKLEECLRSVDSSARQLFARRGDVTVNVVVADNDPDSKCSATYIPNCQRVHAGLVSVARGRHFLLAMARDGLYDFLAFIDDDEVVSRHWLACMVQTASAYDCAGIAGPVIPVGLNAADVPLHARRRHTTGTRVPSAGAGNLMLNLAVVRRTDFDTRWPLPGGEDTDFTTRLTKFEGSIVWCDEGEVFEHVSSDRTSRCWLVRRYFINGRILHKASVAAGGMPSLKSAALRFVLAVTSGLAVLVLPLSSRVFRLFLDKGVRNLGFIYQHIQENYSR